MIDLKEDFKLGLKNIEEIINEVKKPQSLHELSSKYGLPLVVKCVKEFYGSNEHDETYLKPANMLNKILTYTGKGYEHSNGEIYWFSEESSCDDGGEYIHSKKFILWEKI